jgi:hypothetical protein
MLFYGYILKNFLLFRAKIKFLYEIFTEKVERVIANWKKLWEQGTAYQNSV